MYMYILRLRPCRRPPFQQANCWLVNWSTGITQLSDFFVFILEGEKSLILGSFLYLKLIFWSPWGSIFGTWGIILVIQGSSGSPNCHLEVQVCFFMDFRVILGVPWDPLWAPFCDFSVICGVKFGDCFQVHVFGDPGTEMMPECHGCMCYKHSKNWCFWMVSLFPLFH